MKKLTAIFGLSLLFVAVAPVTARAQFGRNDNRAADRVCVYQNNYFQGWEQCYRPGEEISDLRSTGRDGISSIRVYGNASVLVYDDKNFRGNSTEFTSEVRDLGQVAASAGPFGGGSRTWNDRIGSLRVTSSNFQGDNRRDDRYDQSQGRGRGRGQGRNNRDSICVFEEINYGGRSECFDAADNLSDLGRLGTWSDRISSIRVMGNARAVAYLDIDYRGERLVIDRDIADLRSLRLRNSNRTWDNQISSLDLRGNRGVGQGYRR